MIIDSRQRIWFLATLAAGCVALLCDGYLESEAAANPGAGRKIRLYYAIFGSALLLFATMLAVVRYSWFLRFGPRRRWLEGHVWLGLLSLVLLFCHSGWRLGGPLTSGLWAIFGLIVLTGLYGHWLQLHIPRKIAAHLPCEIFDELPRTRQVQDTSIVISATRPAIESETPRVRRGSGLFRLRGAWNEQIPEASEILVRRADALTEEVHSLLERHPNADGTGATGPWPTEAFRSQFDELYTRFIRPYLTRCRVRPSPLLDEGESEELFRKLRVLSVSSRVREIVGQLEGLCATHRKLVDLQRLYERLHGWRRLHGPLTVALLGLAVAHVVTVWHH